VLLDQSGLRLLEEEAVYFACMMASEGTDFILKHELTTSCGTRKSKGQFVK